MSLKAFENQKCGALICCEKIAVPRIIGMYCAYCPRELILAAGAIPIGLCGTVESAIPDAEKDLPRNMCPMVKIFLWTGVSDKCPYFALSIWSSGNNLRRQEKDVRTHGEQEHQGCLCHASTADAG